MTRVALALAASALVAACGRQESAPGTRAPVAGPPAFVEDVTERSGVRFVHDRGAEGKRTMPETMGSGGCALALPSLQFALPSGRRYYLATSVNWSDEESSYGGDSQGSERPDDATASGGACP